MNDNAVRGFRKRTNKLRLAMQRIAGREQPSQFLNSKPAGDQAQGESIPGEGGNW